MLPRKKKHGTETNSQTDRQAERKTDRRTNGVAQRKSKLWDESTQNRPVKSFSHLLANSQICSPESWLASVSARLLTRHLECCMQILSPTCKILASTQKFTSAYLLARLLVYLLANWPSYLFKNLSLRACKHNRQLDYMLSRSPSCSQFQVARSLVQ